MQVYNPPKKSNKILEKKQAASQNRLFLFFIYNLSYASFFCARGSFLNDVAKTITELCFDDLDAPPVVVGARNWITPPFEFDEFFFPQASWILDAIHEKLVPLAGYEAEANTCDEAEAVRRSKAGV